MEVYYRYLLTYDKSKIDKHSSFDKLEDVGSGDKDNFTSEIYFNQDFSCWCFAYPRVGLAGFSILRFVVTSHKMTRTTFFEYVSQPIAFMVFLYRVYVCSL